MTKLAGVVVQSVPGWVGGVQEATEPALGTKGGFGALRSGENSWHENAQLTRRGGTRAAESYAANSLTESVAVVPFSQVGALVVAHSVSGTKHYVTAHAPDGSYALPAGTETESGSRAALGSAWETATAGVPVGAELFEAVYLADDSPISERRPLQQVKLSAGALVVTTPADTLGGGPDAPFKFAGVTEFASVIFGWGYGSEDNEDEPHTMRHSYLGRDPGAATGFDPDAYATIGAQGQPIRAAAKGQGVLLVAKESELYRITGSGSALPGWQFAIQQVDASLGAGCVNARCLVYAEGWWYGLGRDGPWRCDGSRVEPLRSNRDVSWRAVGDLSTAFVVHHPRRRAVCFALPEASSSLSGTAPTVLWAWDLEQNVWGPDQRPVGRMHHAAAIAPSGVVVSTVPSSLAQVLEHGAFRTTSMQLRWTNGLPTQPTEVWLNGALAATLPAGVAGCVLTGLTSGTAYRAKVRHAGTITTPFTSEVVVYTQPNAPRLVAAYRGLSGNTFAYQITNDVTGRAGYVESVTAVTNAFADDLPNLTQGSTQRTKTSAPVAALSGGVYDPLVLQGFLYQEAWPDAVAYSVAAPAVCQVVYEAAFYPDVFRAPIPYQAFDADAWSESAITVQTTPWTGAEGTLTILYRKYGDVDLITADTRAVSSTTLPFTLTITGLEAGEKYEVFSRVVASGGATQAVSPATMCYTAVPTPTATIATAGAGTPVTRITVTPPGGKAGYDTHIENASGSFDSLYTGVSSSATVYQSTMGTCGQADRYFVRARRPDWPEGLEWSAAVALDVVNPCVIAP